MSSLDWDSVKCGSGVQTLVRKPAQEYQWPGLKDGGHRQVDRLTEKLIALQQFRSWAWLSSSSIFGSL